MQHTNLQITDVFPSRLDDTYFRTSDVIPSVQGESFFLVNGQGSWRRWGKPNVTSIVTHNTESIVIIEVTGWHKFTKRGPVGGTYYFVRQPDNQWRRTTAQNKTVKEFLANN